MKFARSLFSGTLILRYKRFLADIILESGEKITAHCPNSGSMKGCNYPGNPVMVSFQDLPSRKLKYTWEMIRVGDFWVGINTQHPNLLAEEAIRNGAIRELQSYPVIRREVRISDKSRIDIVLENSSQKCFVEVKNVTLVENGAALFPDSITTRGQKHLQELMNLKKSGHRAAIFFVIQREDALSFRPADAIDPVYGELLRESIRNGVEILCYVAKISPQIIQISHPVNPEL